MLFAARKQYLLAAIAWSISCTARSNGILYAGFIIYDLVVCMDLSKSFSVGALARLDSVVFTHQSPQY
jgi:phosphatidylinositol glycan class V